MKVSVIVPVYNVYKYLDKCLNSLVNQTLKDIEIIIVNDGSTDSSLEIINKYASKYSNIKIINNTNHGQGYSRNVGIKLASSPYIYFLDGDDYLEYDALSIMYNKIVENNSDIVVCDIYKIYDNSKKIFKNFINYSDSNKINLMLSHQGVPAKLFKKSLFIDNNIFFPECFYEDLAVNPVIASKANEIIYVDIPLYNYVIRNGSTMNQNKFNPKINDIFIVLESLKKPLKNYKEELDYLYIEHLLYSATLRYLDFSSDEYLDKINNIMKKINYKDNVYYKKRNIKFKLICDLAYKKRYKMLKLLKWISGK